MSSKKILIVGDGGHATSCREVIDSLDEYAFEGYVTQKNGNKGDTIGCDSDLLDLFNEIKFACVGIGQIKNNKNRIKSYNSLKEIGYDIPTLIASTAYTSKSAEINDGTIVMHKAFVNSKTKIGKNCIINTGAIIEHGVSIGDNCHIATNAVINGDSVIGDNSFVGSGAVILQGININENCLIGAGVVVKEDLAAGKLVK